MDFWSGRLGGSGSAVLMTDQTTAVSGYFNSMRLPATFMTTQALNTLFRLGISKEDETESSVAQTLLIQVTQFLITVAFMTAITSVVSGTAATVKILHGGFDPVAATPYDMLVRNFEFEFLSVRWTFLTSIFCFLIGMGTQGIVQFGLLDPDKKRLLYLFVGSLTTVTSFLISYVNNNIFDYGSLVGMSWHFLKLIFLDVQKAEPMVIMFMGSAIITGLLFIRMILSPLSQLLTTKTSPSKRNSSGGSSGTSITYAP